MRYAEISISAPTGMDVVPPVPSVPIGALGGVGGTLGSGERRGDGYEYGSEEVVRARAGPSADADLGELEKVDFDPDACTCTVLSEMRICSSSSFVCKELLTLLFSSAREDG